MLLEVGIRFLGMTGFCEYRQIGPVAPAGRSSQGMFAISCCPNSLIVLIFLRPWGSSPVFSALSYMLDAFGHCHSIEPLPLFSNINPPSGRGVLAIVELSGNLSECFVGHQAAACMSNFGSG